MASSTATDPGITGHEAESGALMSGGHAVFLAGSGTEHADVEVGRRLRNAVVHSQLGGWLPPLTERPEIAAWHELHRALRAFYSSATVDLRLIEDWSTHLTSYFIGVPEMALGSATADYVSSYLVLSPFGTPAGGVTGVWSTSPAVTITAARFPVSSEAFSEWQGSVLDMALMSLLWTLPDSITMSAQSDVLSYLRKHPDITLALRLACRAASEAFGSQAKLSLEVYRDPEIDDEYLTLYVRQDDYDENILKLIEDVCEQYEGQMVGRSGWVLVTTDFQPTG
ncbi:MAG TPA: hypothetical protein VEQ11_19145 [Chloroflexota bacterium]|nr:hypothetical protein [Chloroflexota bacterium]